MGFGAKRHQQEPLSLVLFVRLEGGTQDAAWVGCSG